MSTTARYCSNYDASLTCPKCGEKSVHVREHDRYFDGNDYEAFCNECGCDLTVWASVDVVFSEPEIAE